MCVCVCVFRTRPCLRFSWSGLCSVFRPRLQRYRSGLSDTLSVPFLGRASSFTGQDCQTDLVFLFSATSPALPVRTVRLSVPSLGHASSFTRQDRQTDSVFLLLATPPALPVRIVRQTQCSFSWPRLQLYRSGSSDRLSVPFFGHASSFTGQDCQTHSVFLFSATPPALPVRTVRHTQCSFSRPRLQLYPSGLSDTLSVPSLGHACSFTGQDCQTDSVLLLLATPPALPVRTVRHTQCSFFRPRLQLYRSGLSDTLSVTFLGHASNRGPGLFFVVLFPPSLSRLLFYRSGLSDLMFLFSATLPALLAETVGFSVPPQSVPARTVGFIVPPQSVPARTVGFSVPPQSVPARTVGFSVPPQSAPLGQ